MKTFQEILFTYPVSRKDGTVSISSAIDAHEEYLEQSKEGVEEDEINTEFRMIISHALLGCDTKDISRETFDLMVSECTKYSFKLLGYPHPPKS